MRSDCPAIPWASQDFYISYGRHVEQQGRFLCHIVRWFYATTNFTCLIDSTTNTKLLPSPAPSELDICETLTITKHSKTQPTSASTYKARTFFIWFFFSSLLSIVFFNLAVFLFLLDFFYTPCPVTSSVFFFPSVLFPSLVLQLWLSRPFLPQYSAIVFLFPLMLSPNAAWLSSSQNSFVCQNLTYRDLPFRKYLSKKRHWVFLKTHWSMCLVCGIYSLKRLSEEIHMLLKITHVSIFTQKLK